MALTWMIVPPMEDNRFRPLAAVQLWWMQRYGVPQSCHSLLIKHMNETMVSGISLQLV